VTQGLNKAILIGNLGADPELKYTQGNQAVLKIRLATSESYQDKAGERQERTEWHTVTVWGKRAEGLSRVLSKGSRIYAEGRIQSRQWEDKDGNKRTTTEINAHEILLLGGKGESRPRTGGDDVDRELNRKEIDGGSDPFGSESDIPFAPRGDVL
jgi:single-strand DNA-binding protein